MTGPLPLACGLDGMHVLLNVVQFWQLVMDADRVCVIVKFVVVVQLMHLCKFGWIIQLVVSVLGVGWDLSSFGVVICS